MNHNLFVAQTAKILLKINAVSFRLDPPFVFTSGIKSPIYLDNRIIMSYPEERKKIIGFYITIIKERIGLDNVNYISGTATAAIPQASWVSAILDLPMVYVRPSTKSYGKGNKLEGYLKPRSKVVIIEDHISTATSVVNNAQTIRASGGIVKYCITTTFYESKKARKILKENEITLYYLTTGKLIVSEAFRKGLISQKEKKSIDFWFHDPHTWAKFGI